MELSYWESRWRKGKTGFHMPDGYPGLKRHWNLLNLPASPVVLVPLCGKTKDLVQLESFGASVVGVEISKKAILEFFSETSRAYETDSFAEFTIYRSDNIELWQGDFFKFPAKKYPDIDLIYDKAALVALPPDMRKRYSEKIIGLCGKSTSMLLHHFIYPQQQMPGPPFSVTETEVRQLFGAHFEMKTVEEGTISSDKFPPFQRRGLKSALTERLLLLNPRF